MRLELRVRHALGARMVQIEPRPSSRPIVVGRSPEADVQVPVGTVWPRHCLLYLEGEQWVIRDGGSGAPTLVNGQQVDGAAWLQLGDVISLGAGSAAPTIEVDPMGTARRQVAAAAAARPTMPTEQETEAFYPGSQASIAKEVVQIPPQEVAEGENVDWMAGGASAGAGSYRRRPRKRQTSYLGVTIGGALVVIVLGWIIVARMTREDEPPPVADKAPQDVRGGGAGKSIFDFPEGQKPKPKTAGDGTLLPPVAVGAKEDEPLAPRTAADNDPERQTDEWKAVVEANAPSERPGKALWTIVDYRRLHPGKFEGELKQMEDAAFDRLWWERIKELCELRDSLAAEIEKKNLEIAQETEAGFAAKLEKEKKLLLDRRQGVGEILTQEMGYASKEILNLFDTGQMARLRSQRIGETYEGWKRRVTSSLIRTRNLPWERVR